MVTDIFSFSYNVFKSQMHQDYKKFGLCGKRLKSICKLAFKTSGFVW